MSSGRCWAGMCRRQGGSGCGPISDGRLDDRRLRPGLVGYLQMCEREAVDALTASCAHIGIYVRELPERPSRRGASVVSLNSGRKSGTIRRAGRFAEFWMPYLVIPEYLRDKLDQVNEVAADHNLGAHAVEGALFSWLCVDDDGDWARRIGIGTVSANYSQNFTSPRRPISGARNSRRGNRPKAGADRILFEVAAPWADRQRVIETIAESVVPRLSRRWRRASSLFEASTGAVP